MSFELGKLQESLRALALDAWGEEVSSELVIARLMDGLRDAGLPVMKDKAINDATRGFDQETWRRLGIVVRVFREEPSLKREIDACLRAKPTAVSEAFFSFAARDTQLLSLELLLKSPFRIEELARKWVRALGGAVAGETAEDSDARVKRIDFGGVLKNLEAAEKDRVARQEKLKAMEAERLAKEREAQEAYQRAGRE